MSDQNTFLTRWSRRKREAAEAQAEPEAPPTAPLSAAAPTTMPAEGTPTKPPAGAAVTEPHFDAASLPPIESITATTDIRAFLAPGVPADLKRAALRRAWTVDPAIRDFIGLSENSWDFNAPGTMGGFGPLEMTEDLRRIVAELLTPGPESERPSPAPHAAAQQATPAASKAASVPEDHQDEVIESKVELPAQDQLSQDTSAIAVPPQRSSGAKIGLSSPRRPHGGALPK